MSPGEWGGELATISARHLSCRALNERLEELEHEGCQYVEVSGVLGQRYIGTGLAGDLSVDLHGTPGEDLGAFMSGPTIRVFGNAQNAVGNTMSAGLIAVHGSAGDIVGHSMRGGQIWIRDNVGYRVGIHMKASPHSRPVVIVGGSAGDFLGEYMAGGVVVVLGMSPLCADRLVGNWLGTGMHGGVVYLRGGVPPYRLGQGASRFDCDVGDFERLAEILSPYCQEFGMDFDRALAGPFVKLQPVTCRPYRQLYVSGVGEC